MRTLIVDDSKPDRAALRGLLERVSVVDSIHEAGSLGAAREILANPDIDLVFLDIEVGRENGFSLLEAVGRGRRVILTTVHTGYGGQAFDADAVDYLVKPVTEDRMLRALSRAAFSFGRSAAPLARVPVHRSGSARVFLALETLSAVTAEGNYTRVVCGAKEYSDHRRLREWEKLLANFPFQRLDRSTLLRIDHIQEIEPQGTGARVVLASNAALELGRTANERLREFLSELYNPDTCAYKIV
jgi:two-component system LytT family response regulator